MLHHTWSTSNLFTSFLFCLQKSSNKNPLTTKAEATKAYQLFGSEIQKICQPRLQMHCASLHIAEFTHTTHLLNCVYNKEECLKNYHPPKSLLQKDDHMDKQSGKWKMILFYFCKITQQGQRTLANIRSFIRTTQQKKVKEVTPWYLQNNQTKKSKYPSHSS